MRCRHTDHTNGAEKLLVDWYVPNCLGLRSVLPYLAGWLPGWRASRIDPAELLCET